MKNLLKTNGITGKKGKTAQEISGGQSEKTGEKE